MRGSKESNYSLFLRRYLLHAGYSPNTLLMCRELAAATGYEISYCNHLITGGGNLTLDEISQLCLKLNAQFEDIFRFAFKKRTVSPAIANHAYSNIPLEFYLSTIPEDSIPESQSFLWISGLSFNESIRSVDSIVFEASPINQYDIGHLYMTLYDEEYHAALCVKTNAFYSSFRLASNQDLVKVQHHPVVKNAKAQSERLTVHRIALSFRTHFNETTLPPG